MTNNDFWMSISDILSDGFTSESLNMLDNYADQFIAGRIVYKRFSPKEQYGCSSGGSTHVIASLLAAAEIESDKLTAPIGSFKREQQRAAEQEKRIEQWAKNSGCWVDNTDVFLSDVFGERIAEGGEAVVYDNGNTLIKTIGLDYYVEPILALDRVTLHNTWFPETRLTVIGFGRTSTGDFVIIVEQPFIQGDRMSESEIEKFANRLGFKLLNRRNWTYATPEIYLSDLHDENVIRSEEGNIFVIDCDIRINIPDLKCGGSRVLSFEIEMRGEIGGGDGINGWIG